MTRFRAGIFVFVLILPLLPGCSSSGKVAKNPDPPPPPPLIVGVTPNSPPLIFEVNDAMAGIEADFAQLLAGELKRPLVYSRLKWDRLIPELLAGRIDIIMSGMTATEARKVQIDFTRPYLQTRIVAVMRARDVEKYNSIESITETNGSVGVVLGTTAEALVRRRFLRARVVGYSKLDSGVFDVKSGRIDLFVGDGPACVWAVSKNEAELAGFWKPLAEEPLAWGVNRANPGLLSAANAVLEKWEQDGTLRRVLLRWIPYLDKLQQP